MLEQKFFTQILAKSYIFKAEDNETEDNVPAGRL
jgi:hypothetical protein